MSSIVRKIATYLEKRIWAEKNLVQINLTVLSNIGNYQIRFGYRLKRQVND